MPAPYELTLQHPISLVYTPLPVPKPAQSKMFTKASTIFTTVVATMAVFVSGAPQPVVGGLLGGVLGHGHAAHSPITQTTTTTNDGTITNSCNLNTGPVQCCKETFAAGSSHGSLLQTLLGVDLGDITAMVGLQCSPITALVGLGSGASCSSQPVCCSGSTFNGLINVGCSPLNLAR